MLIKVENITKGAGAVVVLGFYGTQPSAESPGQLCAISVPREEMPDAKKGDEFRIVRKRDGRKGSTTSGKQRRKTSG